MIAGDDPTPWKLLSDGTVVAIDRPADNADVVAITVQLGTTRVRMLLAGCDGIRYQPHDEPALYELDAIAASEPDIRDAHAEGGAIIVTGGAGTLRLTYANLTIHLMRAGGEPAGAWHDGARVDVDELARLTKASEAVWPRKRDSGK